MCIMTHPLLMLLGLVETDNLIKWTTLWSVRFGSTIAKGDDSHDSLVLWNLEEGTEGIGITHTHDEGIEAHGTGYQDEVAIAQAIVVCSPAVADFVGSSTSSERIAGRIPR